MPTGVPIALKLSSVLLDQVPIQSIHSPFAMAILYWFTEQWLGKPEPMLIPFRMVAVVIPFQTVIVVEGIGSYAFNLAWIYQGDSIFLAGAFQNTSNIYLDTFPNNEGCDSIIETMLWIYPVQNGTDSLTICQGDSALLGNIYRTTAGIYSDTTIVGGTAIINSTTLFINSPQISSSSMNLNTGDSAFLAGSWRYVSGTYCDTIGACDSINCVTLTIAPVTYVTFVDTIEICLGDSVFTGGAYQFNTGNLYRYGRK